MPNSEIQRKAELIEAIYQEYRTKLAELERQQKDVIENFRKELEQIKLEEIRKSIHGT